LEAALLASLRTVTAVPAASAGVAAAVTLRLELCCGEEAGKEGDKEEEKGGSSSGNSACAKAVARLPPGLAYLPSPVAVPAAGLRLAVTLAPAREATSLAADVRLQGDAEEQKQGTAPLAAEATAATAPLPRRALLPPWYREMLADGARNAAYAAAIGCVFEGGTI
jgi:hypothetical protein